MAALTPGHRSYPSQRCARHPCFLFTLGDHGAFINAARHGPEVLTLGSAKRSLSQSRLMDLIWAMVWNTVSRELLGAFAPTPHRSLTFLGSEIFEHARAE